MSGRATIKSIASDLGISHMTVSRALGNSPNVNEATRKAVLQRAQVVGYVRSSAARVMRGDGTNIVGLLLPNIINEFYAQFANALAIECDLIGLQLIIHLTDDDLGKENEAVHRLQQVQAEMVIMVPSPLRGDTRPEPIRNMRVVELIRTRNAEDGCHRVLVDDSAALSQAVEHLAALGHSRIAYFGATLSMSSGHDRLQGFLRGLRNAGLSLHEPLVHTGPPSFSMGQEAAESVLADGRATAIVCGGFEISNGALNAMLRAERPASERPSFVGYGDSALNKWVNGGITTISIPVDRMARETARLLGAASGGVPVQPLWCVLPAELLIRQSTFAARPRPKT